MRAVAEEIEDNIDALAAAAGCTAEDVYRPSNADTDTIPSGGQ
jgi:hypothetical protein